MVLQPHNQGQVLPLMRPTYFLAGAPLLAILTSMAPQQGPPLPSRPFLSQIVLVPIAVRVIGRDGQPIRTLTQDDFTIVEDGRPQRITQFSTRADGRTFVIVLGRGHLQIPAHGIDAVEMFLRERLQPGDRISLMAYDRATPFTVDRDRLLGIVERYRRHADQIESGLANLERSQVFWKMPSGIQTAIDAVFDDRQPVAASIGYAYARSDAIKVGAGIELLRDVESSRHLIYVGNAAPVGRPDNPRSPVAQAAAAQVALHLIQTGGLRDDRLPVVPIGVTGSVTDRQGNLAVVGAVPPHHRQ